MKALKFLGVFLNTVRLVVVNFVFWGVIFAAVVALIASREAERGIPEKGILKLTIEGKIVDAPPRPKSILDVIFSEASGSTSIRQVIDALAAAAQDDRIEGVRLDLSKMGEIGLSSARVLGAAIDDYKRTSGREVWVWGASFTQGQYIVASHASRLYLHPMGDISIKGLSARTLYFGDFLDKVGVGVSVYKAGDFKSAPEVFTRSSPSRESLESQKQYLDAAWGLIKDEIEKSRAMIPGTIEKFYADLPFELRNGEPSSVLLKEKGFVSDLIEENAFNDMMKRAYGAPELSYVTMSEYTSEIASASSGEVAILFMEGEISSIEGMRGIYAPRVVEAVRRIEEDDSVKAIVVRINSPGGDAMAAEMIRFQLESLKKKKGVPVVVSMGDSAASGGYWVSSAADYIVADPLTLTGSIGVFAVIPDVEAALDKLGIGYGGYQTGPFGDMGNPLSKPAAVENDVYNSVVRTVYSDFKSLVSKSRGISSDNVEEIAQGRVWLGRDAKHLGLVDELGGLEDAVRVARLKAGLPDSSVSFYIDSGEDSMLSVFRYGLKRAVVDVFGISEFSAVSTGVGIMRMGLSGGASYLAWEPVDLKI